MLPIKHHTADSILRWEVHLINTETVSAPTCPKDGQEVGKTARLPSAVSITGMLALVRGQESRVVEPTQDKVAFILLCSLSPISSTWGIHSELVFFLVGALQYSFRVYTFLAFTMACFSLNDHCNSWFSYPWTILVRPTARFTCVLMRTNQCNNYTRVYPGNGVGGCTHQL